MPIAPSPRRAHPATRSDCAPVEPRGRRRPRSARAAHTDRLRSDQLAVDSASSAPPARIGAGFATAGRVDRGGDVGERDQSAPRPPPGHGRLFSARTTIVISKATTSARPLPTRHLPSTITLLPAPRPRTLQPAPRTLHPATLHPAPCTPHLHAITVARCRCTLPRCTLHVARSRCTLQRCTLHVARARCTLHVSKRLTE